MINFLLNTVSDLGHPDDTASGYGNGLDLNTNDFISGIVIGILIGVILTILIYLFIKALKNLKL